MDAENRGQLEAGAILAWWLFVAIGCLGGVVYLIRIFV